jgi:hypothetical protein
MPKLEDESGPGYQVGKTGDERKFATDSTENAGHGF